LTGVLEESDGLCLPHLAQLLLLIKKPGEAELVLNITRSKLEARQAEMAEVIRKNDHHNKSGLISGEEALAWKKAMTILAGMGIDG
jgi:hypothetical protein